MNALLLTTNITKKLCTLTRDLPSKNEADLCPKRYQVQSGEVCGMGQNMKRKMNQKQNHTFENHANKIMEEKGSVYVLLVSKVYKDAFQKPTNPLYHFVVKSLTKVGCKLINFAERF